MTIDDASFKGVYLSRTLFVSLFVSAGDIAR